MVDEISRRIADARPGLVLIDGPAGIGKSRVAAAAAEGATRAGREVVTVRADQASATIPFGAFAPILADLEIDERDELGVLTALHAFLRSGALLVVDDLPLLDDGSATAVRQALEITTVLATARSGQALASAFDSAAAEPGGRRVTLGHLAADQIDDVVRTVLDGPVEPTTVQRLERASGGNPLLLRELLATASASGALAHDDRGWRLDRLDVSPRLLDIVAARLDALGPEHRHAMELLATAQPMPLGTIDADLLDDLEVAGLAASDPTGVRLAHPLHDEVLRAACPPSRWRRRLAEGADVLAAHGADEHPDGVLRIVRMRSAAGVDVDPAVLATAARRAHELLDHELAIELASASLAAGGERYDARWVRGAASSCLRRNDAAETDLRVAVALADGDEQLARALQRLGLQLAARSGRTADALDAVQAEADRLTDPAWRGFVDAEVAKWKLSLGQQPSLTGTTTDPASHLNLCVITALASALDGRFTAAREAIEEGLPLARRHRDVLAYGEELLLVAEYLTLAFSGQAATAVSFATAQLAADDPRRTDAAGTWHYLLAQTHLTAGRSTEALGHIDVACEQLLWRDMVGLLGAARAVRAGALARLGRTADAVAALADIDEAARAEVRTALAVADAEASILAANGHPEQAAEVLAAAGAHGVAAAHAALGAVVAHGAVSLGRADLVAATLAEAAEGREGLLLPTMAEHAAATTAGDGRRLDAVSSMLEQVGLAVDAADAARRAAAAHRRRDRGTLARQAERRADGLLAAVEGTAPPVLTARELEVVVAAAGDRLRSREIADRLGISTRTVDNHLSRAYRKLGVADRVELAAALEELGVLPRTDPGSSSTPPPSRP